MISWIQRYFQHHFRIIFGGLLAVVIVAFVFTIGASPGIGTADHRAIDRDFFGYNLNRAQDQQRLVGDAQLSIALQFGAFSGIGEEQVQNYAFNRAAALHLADRWHVPAATTDEIADAVKTLRMFHGPDGQFDARQYATFRDNLKMNPRGMTEGDIARVIGNDVRAEKVNRLLAGPGYVLPAEVLTQLERADTTWTLATIVADYAAFKPGINPTDADLTKFFEENSFRYEIPPRVVVTCVEFAAGDNLDKVSVTDAEVRAHYDANPARFPKPAAAASQPAAPEVTIADPAADFEAVRPQVEAALRLQRARRLATQAASDLALALFEGKLSPGPAFDDFLSLRQLTARPLAPFTRESGPAELGGSAEVAAEAFRLSEDRLVSDAIQTPAGAVVLFWQETLPATKPLFTAVRETVAADYVEGEKRRQFVELGRRMKGQLESRLKAGDSAEKAAEAASSTGVKLEARVLPPFTLRTGQQEIDHGVLGALERLDQGQVSDMVITADKGTFVFAMEKKAPVLSESNPRYAETRAQLSAMSGRMSGSAYLAELVERELERTAPRLQ
ncbi:MAG: peptidyl-prolyl cis-trans isomerase [Opitutus sp.]